jgi:hypothetical protein
LDECGLADPGITADEHHRRQAPTRIGDGALERRQLGLAADEVHGDPAFLLDAQVWPRAWWGLPGFDVAVGRSEVVYPMCARGP